MDARPRVLFIDRNPSLAGAAADALGAKLGLDVILAINFELASKLLDRQPVDILVADIRVPGSGTGKDFVARFAERHPQAGVVLVSANPVLYTRFYPAYAICLQKPYDSDQLAQAIIEARDCARSASRPAG